ncbi:MAG: signal peptide peptidase SppA [Actinobacteria bacterium]|nr:signal peptide peptidase SppA [Actinomycetota bacterium]
MKRSTLVISIILGIVFISTVIIVVAVILKPGKIITGDSGVIAFIPLSGLIAESKDASFFSSGAGITPTFVRHQLERANDDPRVGAIILKIDSPGGVVGASQEIAELVRDSEKPVIVFAGDIVASGAYYIASQADKIVAKPGSLIGSIGVIIKVADLSGLYAKLGIKVQTIKSGKNKDMTDRTLIPEERKKLQALSDETYRQFINDVAKGRKLSKNKVKELATGEVFSASRAKKLGLIDELGGYQAAVDVAADLANIEDPFVEEYRPPTFLDELFGGPGIQIRDLIRMQALGRDFLLLERIQNTYAAPQYRYYGGQ